MTQSPFLRGNIYFVFQISSNCKVWDIASSQLYPQVWGRNNLVSIMGMIYGDFFPHLIVARTFVELAECDSYNVACHLQGGRDGIYPLQKVSITEKIQENKKNSCKFNRALEWGILHSILGDPR